MAGKDKDMVIEMESDASTVTEAVREVDAWARKNKYVIAPGVPPRKISRGGKILFVITCLRLLSAVELHERRERARALRAFVQTMPSTQPYYH